MYVNSLGILSNVDYASGAWGNLGLIKSTELSSNHDLGAMLA